MASDNIKQDILAQLRDVELLKKGGQKEVFKAIHPKHGTCVFKFSIDENSIALERARREVSLQQSLPSEHFPEIYEFFTGDKYYYIFEQYIQSQTLSELLHTYTDPLKSISLIGSIAKALNPLWEQEIAHRDIKPDNILIDQEGKPYIIDLGIMKDPLQDSITLSLFSFGPCTPQYAAPEQLLNDKKLIGPRTDQFPLGIITYQLCTQGTHPFDPLATGQGESIMHNIVSGTWTSDALVGQGLARPIIDFVEKCLGHFPYQRFRNYGQIMRSLSICGGAA